MALVQKQKKNIMAKAFLWHILKNKSFYDTIHLKIQKHSYVEANKIWENQLLKIIIIVFVG